MGEDQINAWIMRAGDAWLALYEAGRRIEALEAAILSRIHWVDGDQHCDCGECCALWDALRAGDQDE